MRPIALPVALLLCLLLTVGQGRPSLGQNIKKKRRPTAQKNRPKSLTARNATARKKANAKGKKRTTKRKGSGKSQAKKPPAKKPPKTTKLPEPTAGGALLHVAPVDANLKSSVIASAARIDQFIDAALNSAGQSPNPDSNDEQFVRRAYLDITGTIPTARQAFAFINSKNGDKRSILIDHLLNQPGYASHFYNYWGDVLRIKDKAGPVTYTRPFGDWLKKGLRENKPYDEMVSAMLTAEGKAWENPAVGYKLRDRGMPLDNLANTIRVFLGTRIGCAQCHDHPFDRWTQKEFYQLAAYEAGVRTTASRRVMKFGNVAAALKLLPTKSRSQGRLRQIARYNRELVSETRRQLRFPHDYSYDNAKPGQIVKPSVLFGAAPKLAKNSSRREAFATWLASKQNPRFALTIANRLWKRAMGVALLEPVDDIRDETQSANPALLQFLVSEVKRLDFNLKEFQRVIYHTRAYQRQVTYDNIPLDKPYHYPGPALRRMTAEQVWDSLLTLTLKEPDAFVRPSDDDYIRLLNTKSEASAKELVSKADKLLDHEAKARKQRREQSYKGVLLRRASELPQPLPDGHFLRQFGQSDREIIAGSTRDGTVPQVLTMFNGPVTHMMLEPGSVIYDEVTTAKGIGNRVRIIFLSILGRNPTSRDLQMSSAEIRSNGNAGYGNVIWALLNTREFLFIQ